MATVVWFGEEKNCLVSDRINVVGNDLVMSENWITGPSTVEVISELQDVAYMLSQVSFTGSNDRWYWGEDGTGSFSVANVKDLLRLNRDVPRNHVMRWEAWVPLKVNLLAWRLEMDRIPTRIALVRRRINIMDVSCPLCDTEEESSNHVFARCGFAYEVWSMIWKWCKLDPIYVFEVEDLLLLYKNVAGPKWSKKIIRGIVMITCWAIWKERNKKVFEDSSPNVLQVVAVVKSLSFLWIKHRSRFKSIQ